MNYDMIKPNFCLVENFFRKACSKMNLLKVRVGGFRNIKDASLELSDLTALVSLNSYGKSNFLTGINFGIDFITGSAIVKESMMHYKSAIPLNKCNVLQNFFFEFEAEILVESQSYIVSYYFEFQWQANNKEEPAKIVLEQLKAKENKKGTKYSMLISRDNEANYKSAPTGRCNTPINIEKNELVVNKLQAFDQLYFLPLIKQINMMSVYIDRHLDASSIYEPDPIIRKGVEELDISGIANIPRTIFYLKNKYSDKYELLINSYMQLFPNIIKIDVQEISLEKQSNIPPEDDWPFVVSDKIYSMTVSDNILSQPISFERLSDGAKRVFLMLTFAVIADIKGLPLIAFEEPENSVHPSLLQSFLRIITQLTSHCKVIFTSHSPYILQYIYPSDIYIGMPNNSSIASFGHISSKKVKTLLKDVESADTSIGDYIFELMSGSEEDVNQLYCYLE